MSIHLSVARLNTLTYSALSLLFSCSIVQANDIYQFKTVLRTDIATAGIGGMRGVGTQTLNLSGISGRVTEAYLYWHGPTNSANTSANATVTLDGASITGINIGLSNDNCWGFSNSQAYRANVTTVIRAKGNGAYALTNFVKPGGVDINGASLVVFFDDLNPNNDRDIVIFEGNDSNINNPFDAPGWNVRLNRIQYAAGTARIQVHVSDGQVFLDDAVSANSTVLVGAGPVFQGALGPSTQNGSLWDIRDFNVTSLLTPGFNNIQLTTGVNGDCLSLVIAIVDLPAGTAPCVSGGASVSEPITGFPSCGPAAPLSPRWGRFGVRSVLESDAGEKLELECVASGVNYYALYYTSPSGAKNRVGLCPFEGGCNSTFFRHSGDRNANGKPDCFAGTFWRSRDYSNNDIPNPWTGARSESPAVLDHAVSIFDAANNNLTKKNYSFSYAAGPPVVGCLPAAPAEGPLLNLQIIDPPVGPATETFFNSVIALLNEQPSPRQPMSESPFSLADLNRDGTRTPADLQIFQAAFGTCQGMSTRYNSNADFDEDQCVTLKDYQIFLDLYNATAQ